MRLSELSEVTGLSVASIKYYQREGLLPQGTKRTPRLTEYDERHVRRLGLIRMLRELGDISVEGLKRLVVASESDSTTIHEMFAAAADALAPAPAPAGELRPFTREAADQLIEQAGWTEVRPDSPDRENLASMLEMIASYDTHPRDPGELLPYMRVANEIARYELGHLDDDKDRLGLLEEVIVGQVVFGQVLMTLRRLAEEHHSRGRFGDDRRA